jgi:uncharacterized cupin superfamily protein
MSEERPEPCRPVSADDLPWEPWSHGERYGGRVRKIGNAAGAVRIGVHIEELPPGKKSCPSHYHYQEEEQLYVLAGRPTLLLGEESLALKPGDHACFPAGQEIGHCLVNETDEVCRFLMIGERNRGDVVVYPDSGKILVGSVDKVFDLGAVKDYWDGE